MLNRKLNSWKFCACPFYSFMNDVWQNVILLYMENNENDNLTMKLMCKYQIVGIILCVSVCISYMNLLPVFENLPTSRYGCWKGNCQALYCTVVTSVYIASIATSFSILFKVINRQINYKIIEWKISNENIKVRWTMELPHANKFSFILTLQLISIIENIVEFHNFGC